LFFINHSLNSRRAKVTFRIISKKIVHFNMSNVLQCLKEDGVVVRFCNGTSSLSELDHGVFGVRTEIAELKTATQVSDISTKLSEIGLASAGVISLAEKLLLDPQALDHGNLCIQNAKPHPEGGFVYAFANRWSGKIYLDVSRRRYIYRAYHFFLVVSVGA
jgi:hypothetical protein